ncbi:MAG: DUF1972 domain-containing protein [Ferruginibacter sp.]|nr:DUF1972 domain-containing protein [Ferruginibacter sp.]
MKRVAIVGSHGLYANFGGWDQLVRNLAERKINPEIEYLIFNSIETPENIICPKGVKVKRLKIKASGFQGLFFDFWSILLCYWKVDTILFLGVQGIPLIPLLRIFRKVKIISNVGGIEWERPKFGFFSKQYLKFCFNLSFIFSRFVVLDNPYYKTFLPKKYKAEVVVLPYGGEIDTQLEINKELEVKYPFITSDYFLSVSRALVDNLIDKLCESFVGSRHTLVLISNFSSSSFGKDVLNRFKNFSNIILIDGLYNKAELDLIRRKCKAYIHTHTLCGTAPSLVEMIIAQRPIISMNNPQNRFTLHDYGFFFSAFSDIQEFINTDPVLSNYIPSKEICKLYDWNKIVADYESILY